MREIMIVIVSLGVLVAGLMIVKQFGGGERRFNCNMLIGGWHPDARPGTRELCIELIRENNQERKNTK